MTQRLAETTGCIDDTVEAYRRHGYRPATRAFSQDVADVYRNNFDRYRERHSSRLRDMIPREHRAIMTETHFFLRWVYEMATHSNILDAVSGVIGPDILLWSSQWFSKMPGDKAFVSWHQDAAYWGLSPPLVTTAWIALTPAVKENGCLRVIPGSHLEQLTQRETYSEHNMLSRGQEIAVEVDENAAVDVILSPGEFSLHHVGIVHGSEPNSSDMARIGLAVRFISPQVFQETDLKDIVMLVRGKDEFGHFELAEPPLADQHIDNCAIRDEALRRKVANLSR